MLRDETGLGGPASGGETVPDQWLSTANPASAEKRKTLADNARRADFDGLRYPFLARRVYVRAAFTENQGELTMITVIFRDGRRVNYDDAAGRILPEYKIALACYGDDIEHVRDLLARNPLADVDACVLHSNSRGNGTPLILCGCEEIARLSVVHGADVNRCMTHGRGAISPLDSALKELSKFHIRENATRRKSATDLIRYLESQGARAANDDRQDSGP